MRDIDRFTREASQAGASEELLRDAEFVLSASLDDVIYNTPWGTGFITDSFTLRRFRNSSVSTKSGDGGNQVFEILKKYQDNPKYRNDTAKSYAILELIYFCISLGFEGRLRRKGEELRAVKENLFRTLAMASRERSSELSPEWRGANEKFVAAPSGIPVWAAASAAAFVLALVYVALRLWLGSQSSALSAELAALPPHRIIQASAPATPKSRRARLNWSTKGGLSPSARQPAACSRRAAQR
jgi:type VI secretion system protein ImpK